MRIPVLVLIPRSNKDTLLCDIYAGKLMVNGGISTTSTGTCVTTMVELQDGRRPKLTRYPTWKPSIHEIHCHLSLHNKLALFTFPSQSHSPQYYPHTKKPTLEKRHALTKLIEIIPVAQLEVRL